MRVKIRYTNKKNQRITIRTYGAIVSHMPFLYEYASKFPSEKYLKMYETKEILCWFSGWTFDSAKRCFYVYEETIRSI